MNVEKVAEKIFRDCCYGHADMVLRGDASEFIKQIAEILVAFADAKVKKAWEEAREWHKAEQEHAVEQVRISALRESWEMAKEEAAKRADPTLDPKGCECWSCISRRVVASEIRALQFPEGKVRA